MNKMFNYPIEKYKFYFATKTTGEPYHVIAVSTYEGKPVRGVAKCDPRDKFDLEKGKALAAARCNAKIAEKRCRRAEKERNKALKAFSEAEKRYNEMMDYYRDSRNAKLDAIMNLDSLIETM